MTAEIKVKETPERERLSFLVIRLLTKASYSAAMIQSPSKSLTTELTKP